MSCCVRIIGYSKKICLQENFYRRERKDHKRVFCVPCVLCGYISFFVLTLSSLSPADPNRRRGRDRREASSALPLRLLCVRPPGCRRAEPMSAPHERSVPR